MNDYVEYGRKFAQIYDEIFPREQIQDAEVAWICSLLAGIKSPRIVEFGVGTGRVALPLVKSLRSRSSTTYIGIDVSREMLEKLQAADALSSVQRVNSDVVGEIPHFDADLVLCVCSMISMLHDPVQQEKVFRNAADTMRQGGVLVVETHNEQLVRAMHPQQNLSFAVPYEGKKQMLVSFSDLRPPLWSLEHCWISDGQASFVGEVSRLTTLTELDAYAEKHGLRRIGHFSGLTGETVKEHSPTVAGVYRKVA